MLKVSEFICKNLVLFKIHFQQVKPRSRFFYRAITSCVAIVSSHPISDFSDFFSLHNSGFNQLLFILGQKCGQGGSAITSQEEKDHFQSCQQVPGLPCNLLVAIIPTMLRRILQIIAPSTRILFGWLQIDTGTFASSLMNIYF